MEKRSLLLIVLIVMMMTLVGCGDAGNVDVNTNSEQVSGQVEATNQVQPEEAEADKIEFSNIVVKSEYGTTVVNGEATNNDSKKHSFTLMVSFYDADKKLLGTAVGTVLDLGPGDTKTFQAMGEEDYTGAASHKVQVDAMVE